MREEKRKSCSKYSCEAYLAGMRRGRARETGGKSKGNRGKPGTKKGNQLFGTAAQSSFYYIWRPRVPAPSYLFIILEARTREKHSRKRGDQVGVGSGAGLLEFYQRVDRLPTKPPHPNRKLGFDPV